MHKLVGLQLFLSGTPSFSSGTPTFCQMGVLNSCFQNPSESSGPLPLQHCDYFLYYSKHNFYVMVKSNGMLLYNQHIATRSQILWPQPNPLKVHPGIEPRPSK